MRVFLDDRDPAPVLYVQREQVGALIVHGAGAAYTSERYTLPSAAVELHTADGAAGEVIDRVRHALASVKMSQTARREVERALDELDPEL